MVSKTYSAGLLGIDGFLVTVECSVTAGMEKFEVVGLPDNAVREARERVRTACTSAGSEENKPSGKSSESSAGI